MGYLSVPYRVIYEARNNRAGLEDVTAMVMKPDDELVGPFPMVESPFSGIYIFNYASLLTDRPGEHVVMIYSPTEGLQTAYRMSLYVPPPGTAPKGLVEEDLVLGRVLKPNRVTGIVLSDRSDANIEAVDTTAQASTPGEIEGSAGTKTIRGEYGLP